MSFWVILYSSIESGGPRVGGLAWRLPGCAEQAFYPSKAARQLSDIGLGRALLGRLQRPTANAASGAGRGLA